jgi:hypothetical protein
MIDTVPNRPMKTIILVSTHIPLEIGFVIAEKAWG